MLLHLFHFHLCDDDVLSYFCLEFDRWLSYWLLSDFLLPATVPELWMTFFLTFKDDCEAEMLILGTVLSANAWVGLILFSTYGVLISLNLFNDFLLDMLVFLLDLEFFRFLVPDFGSKVISSDLIDKCRFGIVPEIFTFLDPRYCCYIWFLDIIGSSVLAGIVIFSSDTTFSTILSSYLALIVSMATGEI